MKRNRKAQSKGIHLDGKTNQYIKRNEIPEDLPASSQHPLGSAQDVVNNEEMAEDRAARRMPNTRHLNNNPSEDLPAA